MSSVKLFLDVCSDVFLDVEFFESGIRDFYALLLHILTHIDVFDGGFYPTDTIAWNRAWL